jgi:hypothetical protein
MPEPAFSQLPHRVLLYTAKSFLEPYDRRYGSGIWLRGGDCGEWMDRERAGRNDDGEKEKG